MTLRLEQQLQLQEPSVVLITNDKSVRDLWVHEFLTRHSIFSIYSSVAEALTHLDDLDEVTRFFVSESTDGDAALIEFAETIGALRPSSLVYALSNLPSALTSKATEDGLIRAILNDRHVTDALFHYC